MSVYDVLEFRHLKYIIAVAEAGTFTKAAERIHVSQSALSKQILELEELFGAAIFDRTREGSTLTEAGMALYHFARQMMELREEAINSLQAVQQTATRPLRLGFSPFVDSMLLQKICDSYHELFPRGQIRPEGGDTDALSQRVRAGELDAAILTLPLNLEGLAVQPVLRERLVVLLCKDDPLASQAELAASELTGRLAVFSDARHHPRAHAALLGLLAQSQIEPMLYSPTLNLEHVQWMVSEHVCLALIREQKALPESLTTRPVRGADWATESVVVFRPIDRRGAIAFLLRTLAGRLPVEEKTVPRKPPQPVRSGQLPFEGAAGALPLR
ncbi:MAG: LysR family transcriptional regulator [Acidobacteriota bacterium]|nr:LysR family transcriptional regulator [Acidobacteriota bacterium]